MENYPDPANLTVGKAYFNPARVIRRICKDPGDDTMSQLGSILVPFKNHTYLRADPDCGPVSPVRSIIHFVPSHLEDKKTG
jgi:hypothetical protein